MKKDLFLILAILLLSQYYCDDDDDGPCFKMEVTGKEVCTGSEAGEGNHKCCFYKNEYEKKDGTKGNVQGCMPVTKDQYNKKKVL